MSNEEGSVPVPGGGSLSKQPNFRREWDKEAFEAKAKARLAEEESLGEERERKKTAPAPIAKTTDDRNYHQTGAGGHPTWTWTSGPKAGNKVLRTDFDPPAVKAEKHLTVRAVTAALGIDLAAWKPPPPPPPAKKASSKKRKAPATPALTGPLSRDHYEDNNPNRRKIGCFISQFKDDKEVNAAGVKLTAEEKATLFADYMEKRSIERIKMQVRHVQKGFLGARLDQYDLVDQPRMAKMLDFSDH